MINLLKYFVLLLISAFPSSSVFLQNENIWLGGKSGNNSDWFVASNWSKHRIPNETDQVIVPANTAFPVVRGTAVVQALYIEPGAEIQLRDNAVLVIMHMNGKDKGPHYAATPAINDLQFGLNQFCELVAYQGVREEVLTTCPVEKALNKSSGPQE